MDAEGVDRIGEQVANRLINQAVAFERRFSDKTFRNDDDSDMGAGRAMPDMHMGFVNDLQTARMQRLQARTHRVLHPLLNGHSRTPA